MPELELIYKADIQFTGTVEYGVSMEGLVSGRKTVPSIGARFDQSFMGTLTGPRLRGTVAGIDYLNIRADGLFQLHLHGRIITDDGVSIALSSKGISRQDEDSQLAHLRSAVTLFTADRTYDWLNQLHLWAVGTFDPVNAEAFISAYSV